MNAGSALQRVLVRRPGRVLLTFLTTAVLSWTGCVDRSAGPGGSYSTVLSLRVVFSAASNQQGNYIDEWRVQVTRPGEGVIADASGVVSQSQETVQVPQLSVTLNAECEALRVRIELLSEGTVWWVAEQDHQVCAAGNNEVGVSEGDWGWAGPPQPAISTGWLQFTVPQQSQASQTFTITYAADGSLNWNARIEEGNVGWLTLEPSSGTVSTASPQTVTVTVDATGLAVGQYYANLMVEGFSGPALRVFVEVNVVQGPTIGLSPSGLSFEAEEGTNPPAQTFTVTNQGGATLNWSASDNANWLSLSPTSGSLGAGQSEEVTVSVNGASLGHGNFQTTITVSDPNADNSPQTIPVTLTVTAGPLIGVSPASFSFTGEEGGSNPANQTLGVSNTGGGTLNWSVLDNQTWLSLSPTSGSSTGETDNVTVSVNTAGLADGTYNATITATGNASNSPVTVPVTLTVTAGPLIGVSPASFSFTGEEGGSNPANQTLGVSNTGGGTLNWSVLDNQTWLSLSPTSGSSTGETDNVTVSVNTAGLADGTYNATITATGNASNSPVTVPVTLNIAPPATSGPMLFTSGTTGNNEIWVRSASGTELTQLTNTGAGTSNWDAEWSPNGTKIIFSSYRNGLNDHVWIMDQDGSNQTALTTNSVQNVYPSWSPDGSQIVFSSGSGTGRELWVMNADGSSPVQLTSNGSEDSQSDWSPDGSQIVFFSDRTGTWQIWLMNANGSNQTQLTNSGPNDFFPAWSPDGTRIAFVSDRDGNYEIYTMNADGSNQTRLTFTSAGELQPSWSPDGTKIVFMSDRDGQNEIYIMDADGSNQTRLTTIAGNNQFPNIGS